MTTADDPTSQPFIVEVVGENGFDLTAWAPLLTTFAAIGAVIIAAAFASRRQRRDHDAATANLNRQLEHHATVEFTNWNRDQRLRVYLTHLNELGSFAASLREQFPSTTTPVNEIAAAPLSDVPQMIERYEAFAASADRLSPLTLIGSDTYRAELGQGLAHLDGIAGSLEARWTDWRDNPDRYPAGPSPMSPLAFSQSIAEIVNCVENLVVALTSIARNELSERAPEVTSHRPGPRP